jgi:hypothetical protein
MTNEWHIRIRVGFMLDRTACSMEPALEVERIGRTDDQGHNETLKCLSRKNST